MEKIDWLREWDRQRRTAWLQGPHPCLGVVCNKTTSETLWHNPGQSREVGFFFSFLMERNKEKTGDLPIQFSELFLRNKAMKSGN